MSGRTVTRVLVMIEYGPGEPNNGEVFDLTALVQEMLPQANYKASIGLDVRAERTYRPAPEPQSELTITFNGDAGNWVFGAKYLDDVVNSALPDGDRVSSIKKRATRLRKNADKLDHDAMHAKLEQVAAIRHQHPIARVTNAPVAAIAGGSS